MPTALPLRPTLLIAALAACSGAFAVKPSREPVAVDRAQAALAAAPHALAAAPGDRFIAVDVIRDADGATHVRLDRRHHGLRVIGGDVVVHLDAAGALRKVSKTLREAITIELAPTLAASAAEALATQRFAAARGALETPRSELVIHAREGRQHLAWDVRVAGDRADGSPTEEHLLLDAHTGALIDRWDDMQAADAVGSGTGLYSGTVTLHTNSLADGSYELVDLSRGGQTITDMRNKGNIITGGPRGTVMIDADNVWGSGDTSDRNSAGVDAAYGLGKAWDYYLEVFGRLGYADDGIAAEGRVHWGKKLANSVWNTTCLCMRFGDGEGQTGPFVSIDMVGHELTHGVTGATARLTYSRESGALNEATSDILGTMIEHYAQSPLDPPDYTIGEELYGADQGKAVRYMYHPSTDSTKPSSQSSDCWYSGIGGIDVHLSSGVANHFFYLLAEGANPVGGPSSPSCRPGDRKVASGIADMPEEGIGRDAAQRIWYRALTTYFTSDTNYKAARQATLDAATDLFGAGSREANVVAQAWTAVNVK